MKTLAALFVFGCSPLVGYVLSGDGVWLLTFAVWSTTVDLVLVAIPVYVLWGLQMEKVKKIGLCVAFTAGIL